MWVLLGQRFDSARLHLHFQVKYKQALSVSTVLFSLRQRDW